MTKFISKAVAMRFEDWKAAFKNAKKNGMSTPEDFMYMYSADGYDYFKHIGTRLYTKFKKQEAA